jgi:hypothetical protein
MNRDPRSIATTYFEAWKSNDFVTFRSTWFDLHTRIAEPVPTANWIKDVVARRSGVAI